jgi:hypothetical protein
MNRSSVALASDVKRRGLFAMGAALLGAAAAKMATPGQAEAAAGGNFILGSDNDAGTSRTQLTANVASENTLSLIQNNGTGNACVGVNNGDGGGLVGSVRGTGTALAGVSDQGIGLSGTSFASAASRSGVGGFSSHGFGVRGGSGAAANEDGAGVLGEANAQVGVKGTSISGTGVLGSSTSGLAGQFTGAVSITGNLTVNGSFTATGIKSAAVPGPSGSLVRLYCMESPESFFEDFGSGSLSGGHATVTMRPDFAALVTASKAVIFLSEYGDLGGLFVAGHDGTTFAVSSHNGSANGEFQYRIVAPRADVQAARLDNVTLPAGLNSAPPKPVTAPDRLPAVPGR